MQNNNTIFIVVSEAPVNYEVKHMVQCTCNILYILMLAFYVVIVISKLSDTIWYIDISIYIII